MHSISSRCRFAVLSLLSLSLAGCASLGSGRLVASSAPPELSGPAASAIAGDMVTKFAEQVGPGDGTIILKPDGTPFGQALVTSLKSWGYAVATDQKTGAEKTIPLAYVLEFYDGQVLARLSTDGVELGRAYSATAAGASPASPVSVMQRG
ncbi:conjugal transfer protein TrbH [Bradyrhizobium sp. CCGUVB23]|uniref:conjugal transfer protein TrbH n=1 Tax=Bradyrhizobium sp. CCGUVB23 TaxID=2949630 RepID=UPI0020B27DA9|nr:conjugal transfer protein TrbH [Bradyrhizobium sp. CCGUVB23]MCP3468617.1 conjugal transfer protein TrbH [Bradyrhizobium sp. CCGUVB23]